MNTQVNAMSEPFERPSVAPRVLSATRPFYWSVRRELWEHRFIYLAPLAVAGVFFCGFAISTAHLPARIRSLNDPAQHRHDAVIQAGASTSQAPDMIVAPYDMAGGLLMVTIMIVGAFYCLDALHGERRDRSILFWKSLPVSDLTAVLSKASIPLVILPLIAFAVSLALYFAMLLVSSLVLVANGLNAATLWTQLAPFHRSLLLLYHLLTVHALLPAPIYCWLLLVSAWARRAAFLWASLPPLAIIGLEKITFHTSHFAAMLGYLLSGSRTEAVYPHGAFPTDPMTHVTPARFLITPGLWIGLLVAALFLVAAVRLRRYRGPI
jgi:ABC-2 type transport system permease protein